MTSRRHCICHSRTPRFGALAGVDNSQSFCHHRPFCYRRGTVISTAFCTGPTVLQLSGVLPRRSVTESVAIEPFKSLFAAACPENIRYHHGRHDHPFVKISVMWDAIVGCFGRNDVDQRTVQAPLT